MRLVWMIPVLLCAAVAYAQAPQDFAVDGKDSAVTYHIVHKLHRVDGVSHKMEGKARLLPDGKVQVMVRVPTDSFDSGNVNRDEHQKEAVESAKYPNAELKAAADGVTFPTAFPATVEKTFKAQLAFHGQSRMLDVPAKIVFESDKKIRVTGTMTVSLDEFKVERPSLMFVKIDDAMKLDFNLVFTK